MARRASHEHKAQPVKSHKASLSSLTRDVNDTVCVDHLYLGQVCLFQGMDSSSRYYA